MLNPLVSINLVVLNGEKYIRHCLDSVMKQTFRDFELNILDNGSTDRTKEIIRTEIENWKLKIGNFSFVENETNLGMWEGQEKLLKSSRGKYVIFLSVDVILDPDFVKNAVEVMEKDEKIGALQAKIYQWHLSEKKEIQDLRCPEFTNLIDTVGFKIERSRRLTNIGHGIEDEGQFEREIEVFGVEGAVPVFRKSSLEDCRILGEIADHDMFWYSEDLDVAWRMRMLGWKEIYAPDVIAYHDRSTTKSIRKNWLDSFRRIKIRQQIPIRKRRLDWRNYRLAIIKNDFASNFLRDLPYIVFREIMVLGYAILFEPRIFLEIPNLLKLIPRTLKKRKEVMKRTRVTPKEIHKWFE